MEEIWKEVYGFEKRFKISNHGNLISINGRCKGEKILKPIIDGLGYHSTTLRDSGKKRCVRIHTLVAENFMVKPIGQRITVNHKDGVKTNNKLANLEWIESSENVKHAVRTGLRDLKGSKHPNSKLTEDDVLKIRALYPIKTRKEIGLMFGICRRQVGDIINRVNWKHL